MFLDFIPASRRTSHLLKVGDGDRVILLGHPRPSPRVAEVGSLSSKAKIAINVFVRRIFAIFAKNASFLRGIANLQI